MTIYDPDLVSDDPTIRRIDGLVRRVGDELLRATDRFGSFHSPHEGWAVIKEEMDELWEHVRADTGRTPAAHKEAIQVAAMALRYVLDLPASTTSAERSPSPESSRPVSTDEEEGQNG